ncbi:hypothetical protein B566_EDAN010696 [Ephemera danica]|nr:hypothetical protein B566_EDAN010696 [Ephemera danica]
MNDNGSKRGKQQKQTVQTESGTKVDSLDDRYDSEFIINLKDHIDAFEPEPVATDYSSLRNTLSAETRRWRVFRKQADAVQCANRWSHLGVLPFTYQHCNCSRRYFLATHPLELWHRNRRRPQNTNYEIIAEGRLSKLYLDLEFDREENQDRDGARMTDTFNKILLHVLNTDFNLQLDLSHVLNLDSTTRKKFSRHIIYQFPIPVLFRSNIEAGVSVTKACELVRAALRREKDLSDLGISRAELEELEVKDKKGKVSLFVDEGVYTKNRHFRLLGSTKFGRGAPLVVSPENKFIPPFCNDDLNQEFILLASLVTYTTMVEYVVPILSVPSKPRMPDPTPVLTSKLQASPFPQLDAFVRRLVHPCTIDVVLNYDDGEKFVFRTKEPGFCSNVERQHSKSRVLYVVDTVQGLYFQRCHNPGCSNFRSKSAPLPLSVQAAIGLPTDEWDQAITTVFSMASLGANL